MEKKLKVFFLFRKIKTNLKSMKDTLKTKLYGAGSIKWGAGMKELNEVCPSLREG